MEQQEIYLDNAATTRTHPEVADAALEMMTRYYGNPSSLHKKGLEAQLLLESARAQVAAALGCNKDELVFTSGGTEANNLAVFGAVQAKKRRGKTIVAMSFEHSSVLEPLRRLQEQGFTVKTVPPLPNGMADVNALLNAVDEDTILLCCMLVNSEVGTVAPVAEIARQARRKAPELLVHCDAVQAFGKIPFSAAKLGVDLLTVSAHKLHAPKGCGALYIKKGVRIVPLFYGGSQEKLLRPGTENTPLGYAFGLAAQMAATTLASTLQNAEALREYFVNKAAETPGICINSPREAAPYICNISVPGYRSEILLHYLAEKGIFVSSGSACSKGAPSHVLTAMGLAPTRVDSALRVSFCAQNTVQEIDSFFIALGSAMRELARR